MAGQRYSPITTVQDLSWCAETIDWRNTIPGGVNFNAANVPAVDAVRVTVAAAGAAINATSIPLLAAIGQGDSIPRDTVILFGGSKFAQLTAEAKQGDTTLTVVALPVALAANDVGTYPGAGRKTFYSGTLVGRTAAERAAGLPFSSATDAHDDLYINAFDNYDIGRLPEITLLRHGAMVFRKGLRGYTNLSAAQKAKLENWYQFID